MAERTKKIRVMVVEDSAYMRYVISEILSEDPEIEVIEKARDGVDALERLEKEIPDVITLDVQMPRMDGLTFLREMGKRYRIPTIMLSSLTVEGADDTIKALELGAVDFVPKPSGVLSLTLEDVRVELKRKVKAAAEIKPEVLRGAAMTAPVEGVARKEAVAEARKAAPAFEEYAEPAAPEEAEPAPEKPVKKRVPLPKKVATLKKIVAIGCSTGGPRALTEIIPLLPKDLSAGVIVVQHMPPKFTTALAERLDAISQMKVVEAKNGDKVMPGVVYIAPGDYHILVGRGDTIYLNQDPHWHGVRPSVDILMKSVAKTYGKKSVGIVLTGMGVDGREGVVEIKSQGGTVFAEHKSTCVVYGMPRAAVETGSVDRVVPLHHIADELIQFIES